MAKRQRKTKRPALSIIIPTFNEEHSITSTLDAVAGLRGPVEVIVVDGGSRDRTLAILRERGARVMTSERGRGSQMRAGASAARGHVFWFLHADTIPPEGAADEILDALSQDEGIVGGNF